MRPSPLTLFPSVLMLLPIGCGAGVGDPDGAAAATFDGTWSGTWTTAAAPAAGTLTLDVTQARTSVDGTASFGGHGCLALCDLVCQASGARLAGRLDAGAVQVAFDAACPGPHHGPGAHHGPGGHHDVLSGTYEVLGGPCAGEHGVIALTRAWPDAAGPPEPGVRGSLWIGTEDGRLLPLGPIRGPARDAETR